MDYNAIKTLPSSLDYTKNLFWGVGAHSLITVKNAKVT